jgi:hypothetical protein
MFYNEEERRESRREKGSEEAESHRTIGNGTSDLK